MTYLDEGKTGTFGTHYDGGGTMQGCAKAAKMIELTGSMRWVTTELHVRDGVFGRGCASKGGPADIVLRTAVGGGDVVFHGLEVYKP